jgi:hypothetical protein
MRPETGGSGKYCVIRCTPSAIFWSKRSVISLSASSSPDDIPPPVSRLPDSMKPPVKSIHFD